MVEERNRGYCQYQMVLVYAVVLAGRIVGMVVMLKARYRP